jgi:hypothetical protein
MSRLRRFESHRFVGARDTMIVYDCDDAEQLSSLEERMEALVPGNGLQTFGPDTVIEAVNRGFRPAVRRTSPRN